VDDDAAITEVLRDLAFVEPEQREAEARSVALAEKGRMRVAIAEADEIVDATTQTRKNKEYNNGRRKRSTANAPGTSKKSCKKSTAVPAV